MTPPTGMSVSPRGEGAALFCPASGGPASRHGVRGGSAWVRACRSPPDQRLPSLRGATPPSSAQFREGEPPDRPGLESSTGRPGAGGRNKRGLRLSEMEQNEKKLIAVPEVPGWVARLGWIWATSCQAGGYIPVVVDLDFGQRWDGRCVPSNSEIRPGRCGGVSCSCDAVLLDAVGRQSGVCAALITVILCGGKSVEKLGFEPFCCCLAGQAERLCCVGTVGMFQWTFMLARHGAILTEKIEACRAAPEGHADNARCWAGLSVQ